MCVGISVQCVFVRCDVFVSLLEGRYRVVRMGNAQALQGGQHSDGGLGNGSEDVVREVAGVSCMVQT